MILRELDPVRTPITYQSVINSMILMWEYTGRQDDAGNHPHRNIIRLAVAQIAVESGLASCLNYNISGIKSKPNNGRTCWQFFRTRERFDDARLALAKKLGPVEDKGVIEDGLHSVYLLPKHPWCCFRAFESLDDAMLNHLLTLRDSFVPGWQGLLTGDAHAFAHGLKISGYYTAVESMYEQGLEWRLAQELKVVDDSNLVWGDVENEP